MSSSKAKLIPTSSPEKNILIFCGAVLVIVLFFPPLSILKNIPAFDIVDFLLLPIGIFVFIQRQNLQQKRILILLSVFAAYILLTILINGRGRYLQDYFEIYKLIKFTLVICLFSFVNFDLFIKSWLKPIFVVFVFFNLVHYFNVLNFNSFLEQVYFGNNNYTEFGLDSSGVAVSKRMMGFTANPNSNAFIFLLFAILFLPKKNPDRIQYVWFSVAVVMCFLCQSRTATIAFTFVIGFYALQHLQVYKRVLMVALCSLLSVGSSYVITNLSIGIGTPPNINMINKFIALYPQFSWDEKNQQYLEDGEKRTNGSADFTYLETMMHGEFIGGTSMKGRYEIWKLLVKMIMEKPVFGHGPNKTYFYENDIHADNEFLLITWRYGFIGLLIYLTFLTMLFLKSFQNRHLESSMNLMLFLILFGTTSLTNNPFSTTTMNMLFAIMIGLFFAGLRKNGNNNSDSQAQIDK